MGQEYNSRSFKSGNSVALRVPAALGVEPDGDWTVVADGEKLIYSPKPKAKRKFDIDKVWGCAKGSGLKFIKPEDRAFAHRPLLWDDPEFRAKYMPDE